MMVRLAILVAWALLSAGALAQAPTELLICDFDTATPEWRSKFGGHEVVDVERDGETTRAVRLRFDLNRPPHYDWFRCSLGQPVDVRAYRYLSLRIKGDGSGARLIPMLMQVTEKAAEHPQGEIVASARQHWIDLSFEGWRELSVPMPAFDGLDKIADRVQVVNFSLEQRESERAPAEVIVDELRFVTAARGQIVEEQVPYPPADVAIRTEREFFDALQLDLPQLRAIRTAVEAGDWSAAKAEWARHLETRGQPRWTWSRRDRERTIALFAEKGGGLQGYAGAADQVLARDFEWLGVRKKLDHDIEWLQGPVEWTHVLSRFAYWKTLGYAYWGTGESKYAEDFVYMLRDWIADNPVPRVVSNSRGERGTVWRTLEAGIRGDAWFDVMELFMDAPQFDAEAKYLMTKSLVEHARHLHRYETDFRYGNWQVVECTGLAAIGIMLPEFNEAPAWRERAFDYLLQHMEKDVYADGAHHELTPGYHGWVMERFLKASLLCKANGYDVPGLMDRHEKMFEFLMHISKPDGRYASLGDASQGGSIRTNMGMGALLYNRPDMRYLGTPDISGGWIWLFGPDVAERYAKLPARPPDFTSAMLPYAQYCMMRTGWESDDRYLLFDCAPWGGGHSHQDRLQVIAYAGRDLLIDPGIYSYDQPLSRTYFRQSEAHSILLIDGGEQPQSDPKLLAWSVTDSADFAAGEIADEERALRHRRSVLFVKPDYWVVVDHVFGDGEHEVTRLFHFPLTEVTADKGSARTAFSDGTNILVAAADESRLEMRKGWIPTGGATAEEGPMAAFVAKPRLPAALCTVLVPFAGGDELPAVDTVPTGDRLVVGLRVTFPDGQRDEIAIAPELTELRVGEHSARARALCVRNGPRASAVCIMDGSGATTGNAEHPGRD